MIRRANLGRRDMLKFIDHGADHTTNAVSIRAFFVYEARGSGRSSTCDGWRHHGTLLAFVGPSGVGKDALIDFACSHLGHMRGLRFAKRVITRPASVGEVHEAVSDAEFTECAA